MEIAIIKYNAGNIQSVTYALNRLGIEPKVTDVPAEISAADKIIFPGVGEASTAMNYLKDRKLDLLLKGLRQPVLGICLGLQLLCRYSEENNTQCIGVFDVDVRQFPPVEKVPHMGWNTITDLKGKIFEGIQENSFVYFVHSYYAGESNDSISKTNYINNFSSGLQKDNFYAFQFHPEKSGDIGARILKNFIEKC